MAAGATLAATASTAAPVRQRVHWSERIAHAALAVVALWLLAFLAAPLARILLQAMQGRDDRFVGLANFIAYAQNPSAADVAVEQPVGVGAGDAGDGRRSPSASPTR